MNSKNIRNRIVEWLKERLEESGSRGFVVGVSGPVCEIPEEFKT